MLTLLFLFTEAKKMRSMSMLARKDTQWFIHIDSLEDFEVVSFLGRGTFGDVFGARSKKVSIRVHTIDHCFIDKYWCRRGY